MIAFPDDSDSDLGAGAPQEESGTPEAPAPSVAADPAPSFRILEDGKVVTCLICERNNYDHPYYCAYCGQFFYKGVSSSAAPSSSPLDSSNQFCVIPIAVVDGKPTIVSSSVLNFALRRDQALNLAAWIIALADPDMDVIGRLLEEIKNK